MAQSKKAPVLSRSASTATAAANSGAAKPARGKTPLKAAKAAPAAKANNPKTKKVIAQVDVKSKVKKATQKPVVKNGEKKLDARKHAEVKQAAVKPAIATKLQTTKRASAGEAAKVASAASVKPQVAAAAAKPAAPAQTRAVPAAVAKPAAGPKLTAPVSAPVAPTAATPKAIAEKAAAARQMIAAQKKPVSQRHGFKTNEYIVYPAHGVGRIVGIEEQEIAGMSLELFVITFDKEKLTLRVPTGKLASVGMRKLAEEDVVKKAMDTLKGRARIKRTMWSRRAQEYVAKINSGDLVQIAEVVRDLYRSEAQPEQSYSERQLYEDALDRMAREIAAVDKLDERGAVQRITEVLSKSARGRRVEAGDADDDGSQEEVQAA